MKRSKYGISKYAYSKHWVKVSGGKTRRVRRANQRQDYVQASYYLADHYRRQGEWALKVVTTTREPINFS